MDNPIRTTADRRTFLGYFSALGLGGTLLPGVLWSQLRDGREISVETIRCAEELAGLTFTDEQRQLMLEDLQENLGSYEAIRSVPLTNRVPPAVAFDPLPPGVPLPAVPDGTMQRSAVQLARPTADDELAYLTLAELSELIRTRRIGSE